MTIETTIQAPLMNPGPNPGNKAASEEEFWGEDGFSFLDFLDMINPMQHIPVVSDIYRSVTGDELSTGAKLVGGGIYGGVVGFAVSLLNSVVEDTTGEGITDHMKAIFTRDEPIAVAENMQDQIDMLKKDQMADILYQNPFFVLTQGQQVAEKEEEDEQKPNQNPYISAVSGTELLGNAVTTQSLTMDI